MADNTVMLQITPCGGDFIKSVLRVKPEKSATLCKLVNQNVCILLLRAITLSLFITLCSHLSNPDISKGAETKKSMFLFISRQGLGVQRFIFQRARSQDFTSSVDAKITEEENPP